MSDHVVTDICIIDVALDILHGDTHAWLSWIEHRTFVTGVGALINVHALAGKLVRRADSVGEKGGRGAVGA